MFLLASSKYNAKVTVTFSRRYFPTNTEVFIKHKLDRWLATEIKQSPVVSHDGKDRKIPQNPADVLQGLATNANSGPN